MNEEIKSAIWALVGYEYETCLAIVSYMNFPEKENVMGMLKRGPNSDEALEIISYLMGLAFPEAK